MENLRKKSLDSAIDDLIQVKSQRIRKREERKHVIKWFSFCLSILAIIFVFEYKSFDEGSLVQLASLNDQFDDLVDIPATQQPPPPPPAVQQPVVIEAPDEEEIEHEIDFDLDINMNEEDIIEEITFIPEPDEEPVDQIWTIVEEKPTPKGGMQAFYKYIGKYLKYPEKAKRVGIEGKVFMSFVVERDGSLTDVVVMKGIGAGCDEESVRVLQNAPKWKPGKQRGEPVRVRYAFPIVFRLN